MRQLLISSVVGKFFTRLLISLSCSIGGTVGAICTCPLELVKTRFQSSQGVTISGLSSSRPNSSSTIKFTSPSVLIRSAQTVTIATHPSAKCNVAHIPPGLTHKGISFSPQFCRDYLLRSKIIKCMLDVCRTEGYLALFKGLVPTLLGVLPSRLVFRFFNAYFCTAFYSLKLLLIILSQLPKCVFFFSIH